MKRFLLFISLLVMAATARAVEPVAIYPGLPESAFGYTHGTLSVSSFSSVGFSAVAGYRKLTLTIPTSFFFMADGTTSSATIVTSGFPVTDTTKNLFEIETNGVLRITLPPTIAANSIRYISKTK